MCQNHINNLNDSNNITNLIENIQLNEESTVINIEKVKNLYGLKIRIFPTKEQKQYFNSLFGSCRFIYNKLLEHKINEYQTNGKNLSRNDLVNYTTSNLINNIEYSFLKQHNCKILKTEADNLDKAYKNFFRNKKGFPNFKKRTFDDSVKFTNEAVSKKFLLNLKNNFNKNIIPKYYTLYLSPTIGDIKIKTSKKYLNILNTINWTEIQNLSLSKNKANQYFISLCINDVNNIIVNQNLLNSIPTNDYIGLDVGINKLITDSNGKTYENKKFTRKNANKLARLQRKHSKSVLSNNINTFYNYNKLLNEIKLLNLPIEDETKELKKLTDLYNKVTKVLNNKKSKPKKLKAKQRTEERYKLKNNNKLKINKDNESYVKPINEKKNREKNRLKLAKAHQKLTNQKENYLHLMINEIISNNQVIILEKLNVKGMLSNHKLARSLQELSLHEIKRIFEYKCKKYVRTLEFVGQYYPSSKLCSSCGSKKKDLKLSDRVYECTSCGEVMDRDLNAAINIRDEGKRLLMLGKADDSLIDTNSTDTLLGTALSC